MNENRQSRMRLGLDDDSIAFERIEGVEALSTPFTFIVDARADLEIDLYKHIGEVASIEIYEDGEFQRHFHGILVASEDVGQSEAGIQYRLTLKPWTYFLSQNRDLAIYQEKTAPTIIKELLGARGYSDVEFRLTREYQKRVYCLQYRESDFAFISRLMEEEGIFYFFIHSADRHVLVLGDRPSAHQPGKPSSLDYVPTSVSVFSADAKARAGGGKFRIQSWKERVSSGGEAQVTLAEFDFTWPKLGLITHDSVATGHKRKGLEVYDYPGRYQRDEQGKNEEERFGKMLSRVRLDESRAERRVFTGTSQTASIAVGTVLTMKGHPSGRMNARYVVISTLHSIASESFRSGQKDQERSFNVQFEAIPAETPFHPPRVTPKPVVQGLESAVVTGPKGETIYTDKYGRVKVQFHWDRQGKNDENASCWIRVSQTGLLGNQILPRVGHEVLIDFLHGDPDRPIVVGRVYNAGNMPVYELPAEKTKAVWRTLSYGNTGDYTGAEKLDTGEPRANELRFEDKGGAEEVFLHAERDMNVRVRWQETHHVGHDQTIKVGNNRTETVRFDEKITIGGNRTEEVKKDESVEIKGNQELTVVGNRDSEVKGKEDRNIRKSYRLEAATSIELICGGSSIKIDPTGITLKGMAIKVEGGVSAEVKSVMTTVNASGMLTLKGGMTFIN